MVYCWKITLKKWFLIKTGRRLFCGGVEEKKFSSEKFSSGQFYSTTLRCGSFSEKNIEKKHLCYHDKNYCYFCKSNIPVNNLIVGSRNMIRLSKIWVCKKLNKRRQSIPPNTSNSLAFFIVFESDRILESLMDIWEVKYNAKLRCN